MTSLAKFLCSWLEALWVLSCIILYDSRTTHLFNAFIIRFCSKNMEWIQACLMLWHTHEHIFLILLRLLRGIEESIEDLFEGLYFIDRSSFLVLTLNCHLILKSGSIEIHSFNKRGVSFHYKWAFSTWSFEIHLTNCSCRFLVASILFLSLFLDQVFLVLWLVLIVNICIFTEVFRVLDLVGQLLYGLCDFCLESALKEHCEGDKDQQVEDQEQKLEIDKIGFDESLQVVLDKIK